TDPFVGCREKHPAQRGVRDCVPNGSSDRTTPVLIRRHTHLRGGPFVQPAARAVARIVHGSGDRVTGPQVALQLVHAAGIRIGLRTDPQNCLESSLQVKWTLAELCAQPLQGDRFVEMLLNVPANGLHHLLLRIAAEGTRAAAQAGAVAGFFRIIDSTKKGDVFTPRPTCRTGWPAINARRRHCKNKLSVLARVTIHHCLPLLVFVKTRHLNWLCRVEYLSCVHNEQSLCGVVSVGHPDLAVKPLFRHYAWHGAANT